MGQRGALDRVGSAFAWTVVLAPLAPLLGIALLARVGRAVVGLAGQRDVAGAPA